MKVLKTVEVDKLIPYENNPRHIEAAVDAVAASIQECGYCAPIVVDEKMVILAGHTRYAAVKKLGWNEVPVIIQDGMTQAQRKKYRLLDNRTAEVSKWDYDLLRQEAEMLDFGFDFGIGELISVGSKIEEQAEKDRTKSNKNDGVCTCPRCGKRFKDGELIDQD